MKRLGLIGGMSWQSTTTYYTEINRGVAERLGGLRSADLVLRSLDFAPLEAQQAAGEWNRIGAALAAAAGDLQRAGAQALVLCTNTMHKVADAVEAATPVPLLHIADALREHCLKHQFTRAALFGTRFTMREPFLRERLASPTFHLDVPAPDEQHTIDRVIFEELCVGVIRDESRDELLRIAHRMRAQGAQAVLLCCTELGDLLKPSNCNVPVVDSTRVHARAAVEFMLRAGAATD